MYIHFINSSNQKLFDMIHYNIFEYENLAFLTFLKIRFF